MWSDEFSNLCGEDFDFLTAGTLVDWKPMKIKSVWFWKEVHITSSDLYSYMSYGKKSDFFFHEIEVN